MLHHAALSLELSQIRADQLAANVQVSRLGGLIHRREPGRRCEGAQVAGPSAAGVETAYLRARELFERSGDRAGLFNALLGLRANYNFRAEARQLGVELFH